MEPLVKTAHGPLVSPVVRLADRVQRLLEVLSVALLAIMVAMVFTNVVLRFVFHSGIVQTEEVSRYAFIWLTFLGAVIVLRQGGHLGVDTLLCRLPESGRWLCRIASNLVIIGCCVLLLIGSWSVTLSNAGKYSQASSFPMVAVFGVGLVAAPAMIMVMCVDLYLLFTQRRLGTVPSAISHVD